jgi:hypothetical protein
VKEKNTMKTKLSRHAKGKRPDFMPDEPGAQRLMSILMALVTEVAVLRERLDTVEQLAAAKGVLTDADIEEFTPSLEHREAREAWRQTYLDRVLHVLSDEVARDGSAPWGG